MTSADREQMPRRIGFGAFPRYKPWIHETNAMITKTLRQTRAQKRTNDSSSFTIASRASKRINPANLPPFSLMRPSSEKIVISASLEWKGQTHTVQERRGDYNTIAAYPCRRPVAKSLGSCAGVTFTAPVPNAMSTSTLSVMIGIVRELKGCCKNFPCRLCTQQPKTMCPISRPKE